MEKGLWDASEDGAGSSGAGTAQSEPGVALGRLGVVSALVQVCPGLCVPVRRCPGSVVPGFGFVLSQFHVLQLDPLLPGSEMFRPSCAQWVSLWFGAAPVWGFHSLEIPWFATSRLAMSRFGDVSVRDVPVRSLPAPFPRHTVATSRPRLTPTGTGTPPRPHPNRSAGGGRGVRLSPGAEGGVLLSAARA